MRYSLQTMPMDSDGQVEHTIALMSAYAIEDAKHPFIVERAKRLKARWLQGTPIETVLFDAAQENLQFVLDRSIVIGLGSAAPKHSDSIVEVLVRPVDVEIERRLKARAVLGDCDDFSMYVVCLALALEDLGVPASNPRFVTVAADSRTPDYSHVYVRVDTPEGTRAIDASHGEYAGWEVPSSQVKRCREWPVNGSPLGLVMLLVAFAICAVRFTSGG
jgi:hypothetical protein